MRQPSLHCYHHWREVLVFPVQLDRAPAVRHRQRTVQREAAEVVDALSQSRNMRHPTVYVVLLKKMDPSRRLSLQKLECGFSSHSPLKITPPRRFFACNSGNNEALRTNGSFA